MFPFSILCAVLALNPCDRAIYDSIMAPRVTGVPPFYALRRLTRCEDGELRHYGREFISGRVREVYVASRDCGLTWKMFLAENGDPGAMVKSPVSGDWISLFAGGFGAPLFNVRSAKGPGDTSARRVPLDVGRFTFFRLPVYLPVNRRWVVTGGHSASHPMLLLSDDDAHTWRRVDVTNVVSTAGRLVGGDLSSRWDNRCCEPTVMERKDGTLVMFVRTSFDHPYAYRSIDGGDTWEGPKEVPYFWMSNTMPTFHRLRDGRLLFFWNNCQPLPKRDPSEYPELKAREVEGRGETVFTNRDVLHCAISEDDGDTWIGCREILLNPIRDRPDFREMGNLPPRENDKSVHQEQILELEGGKVLVAAGQNSVSRRLLIFDPLWLYEKERCEDFRYGLNGLSSYLFVRSLSGGGRGWAGHCAWNRIPGAVMRREPDTNANSVRESLNLARIPDPRLVTDRQGIAWNFPTAKRGVVELDCRLEGLEFYIALGDHFITPSDEINFDRLPVVFKVAPDDVGAKRWLTVSVEWNSQTAILFADGREIARCKDVSMPQLGFSYMHLRATVERSDLDGTYFRRFWQHQ